MNKITLAELYGSLDEMSKKEYLYQILMSRDEETRAKQWETPLEIKRIGPCEYHQYHGRDGRLFITTVDGYEQSPHKEHVDKYIINPPTQPLVIDEMFIVDGCHRLVAAIDQGRHIDVIDLNDLYLSESE